LAITKEYIHTLNVINSFTENTFTTFSNLTTADSPGIYAITWSAQVLGADRAAFESSISSIVSTGSDGSLVYRSNASSYWPIYYHWASVPDYNVTGYDLYTSPVLSVLINNVITTGTIAIGPRVIIKSISKSEAGIVMMAPFYPVNITFISGSIPVGIITTIIRASITIESALTDYDRSIMYVDVTDASNDQLLYSTNASSPATSYYLKGNTSTLLTLANRTWRIDCIPFKSYYNTSLGTSSTIVFVVMFCAVFILGLIAGRFIYTFLKTRENMKTQAQMITQNQKTINALWSNSNAILKAVSDPLLTLDVDGNVSGANDLALHCLGYLNMSEAKTAHISELFFMPDISGVTLSNPVIKFETGLQEMFIKKADGSVIWGEVNISKVSSTENRK